MWSAPWNKQYKRFEIQFSVTPIAKATKSHTKAGLWNQLKNNFAYLKMMREYGKCTFIVITTQSEKIEHETVYKHATGRVEKYGKTTFFHDGSRTNFIYNYKYAV